MTPEAKAIVEAAATALDMALHAEVESGRFPSRDSTKDAARAAIRAALPRIVAVIRQAAVSAGLAKTKEFEDEESPTTADNAADETTVSISQAIKAEAARLLAELGEP